MQRRRPTGRQAFVGVLLLLALVATLASGAAAPGAAVSGQEGDGPGFVTTDDFFLAEQWGLFSWGQEIGGEVPVTVDMDARIPEAWSVTMGDPDIVVAVIDTGVARDHPDLAANMWRNPGETGGGREDNGVDDDGNGFVDDWRGWDFVDDDNDPADVRGELPGVETAMFHGTAVASVVAAEADNGIGVAGVAPRTGVMVLRALGDRALDPVLAQAIDYAAANGAHVVNLSIATLIPGFGSPATADAIARHRDVLFVVAAGNLGGDVDVLGTEPCTVAGDNVICVAAHDQHGEQAEFTASPTQPGTNVGAEGVDLAAPGDNIIHATAPTIVVFEDGFESPLVGRWDPDPGSGWDVGHGLERSGGSSLVVESEEAGTTSIRTAEAIDTAGRGCRLDLAVRSNMPPTALLRLLLSVDGGRFVAQGGPGSLTVTGTTDGYAPHSLALPDTEELRFGFELRVPSGGRSAVASIDDVVVSCTGSEYGPRDYAYAEGTSFAAPHVAGAAALVLAVDPDLSPSEVKDALLSSAARAPAFEGVTVSGGRLDAHAALLAVADRDLASEAESLGGPTSTPRAAAAGGSVPQPLPAGGPVPLPLPDEPQPVPDRRGGAAPDSAPGGGDGGSPQGNSAGGGDPGVDEAAAAPEDGAAGSGLLLGAAAAALAVAAGAGAVTAIRRRRPGRSGIPQAGLQLPHEAAPREGVIFADVAAARAVGTAGALVDLASRADVSPEDAERLRDDAAEIEAGLGDVVRVHGQLGHQIYDYNLTETLVSVYFPTTAHQMYLDRKLRETNELMEVTRSLAAPDARSGPAVPTSPPIPAPGFNYDPKTGVVDILMPDSFTPGAHMHTGGQEG